MGCVVFSMGVLYDGLCGCLIVIIFSVLFIWWSSSDCICVIFSFVLWYMVISVWLCVSLKVWVLMVVLLVCVFIFSDVLIVVCLVNERNVVGLFLFLVNFCCIVEFVGLCVLVCCCLI